MKVAFFHDAPLFRGIDNNIYSHGFGYDIWKRYLEQFEKVVVCTRQSDIILNNYDGYRISSGDNVEFRLNTIYKNPIQLFTERKKINEPIKEVVESVDCCIIRLPSVIGMLAAEECIRQKKKWAVEVVSCCWDTLWHYGSIKGKLFAPIMHLATKYYIKKSTHSIYVSEQFLQKSYPCNGIVYSASDVNIKSVDEDIIQRRIEKIKNRTANKSITLGLIGSLNVEFKGHRTAIKIIKQLRNKGYDVKLKCLGGGNKSKWEVLSSKFGVSDYIEFCGILPSGDPVLRWLDSIDIFIMPSLTEGMPRSMIEAMSRGCNIVGSRVGGITELLEETFLVNPKSYKIFSNIIIKLIEDEEFSINQAQRNFVYSKKYEKEKIDKKRKEFFELYQVYCKLNEGN